MSRVLMTVAALAAAVPSTAQSAVLRKPTGSWVVDYADSMCVLQRDYGNKGSPSTLAFKPIPMTRRLSVYLFDAAPRRMPATLPVEIAFGSSEPSVTTKIVSFHLKSPPVRKNGTALSRTELERAARSGIISLKAAGRLDEAFAVPRLDKALLALDECVADLLAGWGFTRDSQARLRDLPEPTKPVEQLVSAGDYPQEALNDEASGTNTGYVRVDRGGKPSECKVVESSGSAALDAALCRVMLRARFKPARDQGGQPMDSLYVMHLSWRVFS